MNNTSIFNSDFKAIISLVIPFCERIGKTIFEILFLILLIKIYFMINYIEIYSLNDFKIYS